MGGDFSDQLAQGQILYDPTTEVAGVRQPFPGNKITPSSSIGKQVAALFPIPTNGSFVNNYLGRNSNSRVEEHYFVRLDHNLTQRQSLHGTYRRDTFYGYQPDGFLQNNHFATIVNLLDPWWDWIVSPNLLNHAAAAYIHYGNPNQDALASDFLSPNTPTITVPGTYPTGPYPVQDSQFAFTSGYSTVFPEGYTVNSNTTWEYDDFVTWTKGRHSLKFGERYDAFQQDAKTPQGLAGAFNFSNTETGIGPNQTLTSSSAGNPIASLLLGYTDNANAQDNVSTYARSKYFALFAQDSWRVTTKLTANYGIRWEMATPVVDAKGNMTTMNPTLANSGAGGIPGGLIFAGSGTGRTGSNSFVNAWKGGWSPRLGLAYDLGHNMVVRVGYGIMYAPLEYGYDQSGFTLSSSAISPNSGYTPAFSLDGGFPAAQLITSTILSPPSTTIRASHCSIRMTAKVIACRTIRSGSSTCKRPSDRGISTLAMWARRHDIAGGGNPVFDQVNPKYLSLGSLLTDSITDPAVVTAGFTPPYPGFTGSLAQALRPFPQYTGVSATNYPWVAPPGMACSSRGREITRTASACSSLTPGPRSSATWDSLRAGIIPRRIPTAPRAKKRWANSIYRRTSS